MRAEGFAPAKVNLTLHVTGRREDGYHLLDSLVVFADVGDRITVEPADGVSLTVSGPFADGVPADESNLVMRAARLLARLRGVSSGAHLNLEKHLPHGGGIGGGSSDAAAAVRILADLWGVPPLTGDEALDLGADVPVCLMAPHPMRMRGIGEVLDPAPALPEMWLVLVNPGVHVPTPQVFRELAGRDDIVFRPLEPYIEPMDDIGNFDLWLSGQGNHLTPCTSEFVPEIQTILKSLGQQDGCHQADMSGSGSTCWGLFTSSAAADRAAGALRDTFADWWVRAAQVCSG